VENVVVTGMGMVTSLGATAGETYRALLGGCSGVRPISGFDTEGFDCRIGAQASPINPSDLGIHPRDARIMGLQGLMLMKAARDAFAAGGLDRCPVDANSTGLFMGMGMVDYEFKDLLPAVRASLNRNGTINDDDFFSRGYREIYPLWPLSMLNNMALCQVAIHLGIKGENAVFAPYGDAGAWAVAEGVNAILENKAAVVLAGGVSEKISPLSLARGLSADILNTEPSPSRNVSPPFRAEGRGTILGEGCGVMVLESQSSAEKRGAPFLAKVSGFGSAFEREKERNSPTARAVQGAMEEAMADAGIDPARVDLVIAHGDGTDGDKNEIDAIAGFFADAGRPIDAYASKGALGNLFAASPVVDAILSICMMEKGMVPATLHVDQVEHHTSLNLICRKALQKGLECVLINTRSHEGQCASLLITACR